MTARFRNLIRTAAAAVVLGATMLLGEAAVRPEQSASADNWQYIISNLGEYCEGCCDIPNSLCCTFSDACRRPPPVRPG